MNSRFKKQQMLMRKHQTPTEQLEEYEEKRKYPRIVIDCPVTLVLPGAGPVVALAYDISPGGIQVRGDRNTARLVISGAGKLKNETGRDFDVNFVLPLEGKQARILLRCKLVYVINLDPDVCVIGMQFTKIDGDSKKALKRFIEVSMEPP